MNAYEQRRQARLERQRNHARAIRTMKLHQLALAERYYISAYTALNGQPPLVIPAGSAEYLKACADQLFSHIHALELGGNDERC